MRKIATFIRRAQPFCTKWTLDVKTEENCDFYPSRATLSHEMDIGHEGKIATFICRAQPFHTKWTLDVKNCGKLATLKRPAQPLRTKWTLDIKN